MISSIRTPVFRAFFVSVFACMAAPAAAIPITASNTTIVAIPDSPGAEVAGPTVTSTITFGVSGIINDLTVTTALAHTFPGDLVIRLVHGSTSIDLMSRPNNGGGGYSGNFVASAPITFDDDASTSIMNLPRDCTFGGTPACGTVYRPVNPLSTFDGVDILGTWTLQISDHFVNDAGQLSEFRIDADIAAAVPEPATIALLGIGLLGMARHRRRAS